MFFERHKCIEQTSREGIIDFQKVYPKILGMVVLLNLKCKVIQTFENEKSWQQVYS